MIPVLRELLTYAIGDVALDRERIRREVDGLVQGGFLPEDEASELLQALTETAAHLQSKASQRLESVAGNLGDSLRALLSLPNAESMERIWESLEKISARLDDLEAQSEGGQDRTATTAASNNEA